MNDVVTAEPRSSDTILVTDAERRAARLTPESLARALAAFEENGYVVLENVVPTTLIAEVKDAYLRALAAKVARFGLAPVDIPDAANAHGGVNIKFEPKGANHDVNRWNMHLPSTRPFLHPQIIGNEIALQLVGGLIPDPVLFIAASDTPFPGSTFQNAHQDFHRFGLTLNIPLVDFTETNGPLEVWPTSHRREGAPFTFADVEHDDEALTRLVATLPKRRMLVPAGSLLLRDQRLIHRGTHNAGTEPRPAISLWYKEASIPVPHRTVANLCQRFSLKVRESARRHGEVADHHRLNKGNLAGRFVDEFSNTDRDYRRRIPAEMWRELSPIAKRSLRFAEVEGEPRLVGSLAGDAMTVGTIARFLLGRDFLG